MRRHVDRRRGARAVAADADRELRAGRYRGPLHGIPYGVKDLFSTRGIRTTWGANLYKDQVPSIDATVVERLRAAGAVLAAKLTTGELAIGDLWFGGRTTQSVGSLEGIERIVRRPRRRDGGRPRGVCRRHGDRRIDHLAISHMRRCRTAPDVRPREPVRRDDAALDDGQGRTAGAAALKIVRSSSTRSTGRTAATRRSSTRRLLGIATNRSRR